MAATTTAASITTAAAATTAATITKFQSSSLLETLLVLAVTLQMFQIDSISRAFKACNFLHVWPERLLLKWRTWWILTRPNGNDPILLVDLVNMGGNMYLKPLCMHSLNLNLLSISLKDDPAFKKELDGILKDYVGRETPLYFAERLTEHYKRPNGQGPHIYLKREDLNHTGAHKINNAIGQVMLAKRLGKQRIIAETGAGQHGVATATVCARFGLPCVVYMGAQDMERQELNVFRMRLLGAEVRGVHSGTATLKDATSEAIRDWVTNVETTHYILGSVAGPHPFPMMVREFHRVIGIETRKQALEKWGGKPDVLVACVGGGSNAMGLFDDFIKDKDVRMIGVEAAGLGVDSGKHAATLTKGEVGVLHGAMSYLLQDEDGQIIEPHSISAGLDYPGVGP
ncbi:hypothetical protein OIU77_015389 [Salix suchowensis]|uniref:Tryptophan synthase n=1 Tax=Salix suchowensis TaxID=1278906 RepID=A0ABQ8ZH23_9ROSI|nr:hypothetical protein OIU77_015389 [Salix suchowensis]